MSYVDVFLSFNISIQIFDYTNLVEEQRPHVINVETLIVETKLYNNQ